MCSSLLIYWVKSFSLLSQPPIIIWFHHHWWYTCTHTKTMYDVCAHSNLPTSAILVLGLLEKKDEQFAWAAIMHFRVSGASQAYFGTFKGCYQHGYYCREHLYSQISLKVETVKKTGVFVKTALETPYYMITHIFSQSWHSCKLICKRSSSTHNSSYCWVSLDPAKIVPLKLGPLSVGHHLEIPPSSLPATLQYLAKSLTLSLAHLQVLPVPPLPQPRWSSCWTSHIHMTTFVSPAACSCVVW